MLSRGTNIWNNPLQFAIYEGFLQRFFTTTAASLSQSWTVKSVPLAGNFDIFDFVNTGATVAQTLYSGGIAAGNLEVSLTAAGLVKVDVAGVNIFTGVIAVNDNKSHELHLSRTGTTASLFVDGVADGTGTMSGTVDFDTISGRTGGSIFFSGVHYDFRVLSAGVPIHFWKIDEDWVSSNALRDSLTVLGAELFDGVFSAGGGGTIDTVDGVTTVTNGVGGFDYAFNTNAFATVAGQTYIMRAEIIGGTSLSNHTFGAGSAIGGVELGNMSGSTAGVKEFTFTATDTTTFVRIGSNLSTTGLTLEFSGLTIKEAAGYGQAINIDEDDAEVFFRSGKDFFGVELWSDAVVTPTGDWSRPSAGVYEVNGSTGNLLSISPAIPIDVIYQTKFTVSNNTMGDVRLGSQGYFTTSGNDNYSVIGVDNTAEGFKRSGGTVVATLTAISKKRILEGV